MTVAFTLAAMVAGHRSLPGLSSHFVLIFFMTEFKYDQTFEPVQGVGLCEELGGFLSMFMASGHYNQFHPHSRFRGRSRT